MGFREGKIVALVGREPHLQPCHPAPEDPVFPVERQKAEQIEARSSSQRKTTIIKLEVKRSKHSIS